MYPLVLTNQFGQSDYYMRLARHVKHMDKLSPEQYATVQAKCLTVRDCVALARYWQRTERRQRRLAVG